MTIEIHLSDCQSWEYIHHQKTSKSYSVKFWDTSKTFKSISLNILLHNLQDILWSWKDSAESQEGILYYNSC